jgi:hypothetical protein
VNHRDVFGQQILDAILEDGMRVAPADLHELEGAGSLLRYLLGQFVRDVALSVFVYEFHKASKGA